MGYIVIALVVAILLIIGAVGTDVRTERAYGLLALALLAAVTLGYLWLTVLGASAQANASGTDDLSFAIVAAVYIVATFLAITIPCVVGLIEMAIERRWSWFDGLLAVIVALAVSARAISLMSASGLVGEAVVLAICAGYGIRATWFRPSRATR